MSFNEGHRCTESAEVYSKAKGNAEQSSGGITWVYHFFCFWDRDLLRTFCRAEIPVGSRRLLE
uniref:Uncharacterized protein n=1 Tax=Coturnix japonica TaxID=93934 RepID=A0A8C2SS70_COTJA